MERMEAAIISLLTKHLQCGVLGCCSKCKERQIAVLTMGDQFANELVLRINLIFCDAFDFCILLQNLTNICKRGL